MAEAHGGSSLTMRCGMQRLCASLRVICHLTLFEAHPPLLPGRAAPLRRVIAPNGLSTLWQHL